jgi:hypothetical protein
MKKATVAAFAGLCTLAILPPPVLPASKGAGTILKCQDASGRWHYGDSAAASCAESKITVIDQQGIKRGIIDAPPTATELKERQEKKEEEERAQEQAKRDEVLLTTYSHEDDIFYIRDRKVAQLEASIKANADTLIPLRATLKRMEAQAEAEQKSGGAVSEQTTKALEQTKSQIGKQEAAIAQRRQEQAAIKAQAARDLARYRVLKGETKKVAAPPVNH